MSIRTARSSKRLIAAAVAVAVTASTFAISNTASADPSDPEATRVSGATRFETAGAVAAKLCTTTAPTNVPIDVVIVNGRNFPDGIAASALKGNILLTETNELPAGTVAALNAAEAACGIASLTVVGGTAAVSAGVFDALKAWADDKGTVPTPTRLAGDDRIATALEVAPKAANPETVVLATANNFPDALTAGVIADNGGFPVLLTSGAALPADVKTFIATNATKVIIIGGTTAVPASIATELNSMNKQVVRLGGDDRAATAVEVADYLAENGVPANANPFEGVGSVVVVNGWDFADALAAARYASSLGAPVLLARSDSIPAATAAWHVKNSDTLTELYVVGGTSAVSASVAAGAVAAATSTPATLTGASVAVANSVQATTTLSALTFKAVVGGAADGAAGNDWSLEIVANETLPLSNPSRITVTNSATVKAITLEIRTTTATDSAGTLVTKWNASAAGALFTAALAATQVAANPVAAAGPATLTDGRTKATVTISFSRNVTVSAVGDLAVSGVTTSPTGTPVIAGVDAITLVFDLSSSTQIPVVGTTSLTIASGTVTTVGLTGTNTLQFFRLLTAG